MSINHQISDILWEYEQHRIAYMQCVDQLVKLFNKKIKEAKIETAQEMDKIIGAKIVPFLNKKKD